MKSKRYIAAMMLVVAGLGALWWFRLNRPADQRDVDPTAISQGQFEGKVSNQTPVSVQGNGSNVPLTKSVPPQAGGVVAKMPYDPGYKNVPIHFWGKVVDLDGLPLSGVEVRASARKWTADPVQLVVGHFERRTVLSGPDGRFEIRGFEADTLTLEGLFKPGYTSELTAPRTYGYNVSTNIRPDPAHPMVLRMWKEGFTAPLVKGDPFFAIIPDGRVYTVDLLKGTLTPAATTEGDLRLWIQRSGTNLTWTNKFDWSLGIEVIGGGLLRETDGYSTMSLAPADGYEPKFERNRKATERGWGAGIANMRFYLKSRQGQVYGRLDISAYAFYGKNMDGRIRIVYAVNPAGSRFLR